MGSQRPTDSATAFGDAIEHWICGLWRRKSADCEWLCNILLGLYYLSWLLGFVSYVLAKSMVISWWVLTCVSAHSWELCSAASLEVQVNITIIWYPNQSHYPDNQPTSHCPILIMPSGWFRSDKYQFLNHWFDTTRVWIPRSPQNGDECSTHFATPTDLCNRLLGIYIWLKLIPVENIEEDGSRIRKYVSVSGRAWQW